MNSKDLIIELYPAPEEKGLLTGKMPAGVKVTHKPAGLYETCCGFGQMHKNKDEAIRRLTEKLSRT